MEKRNEDAKMEYMTSGFRTEKNEEKVEQEWDRLMDEENKRDDWSGGGNEVNP